MASLKIPVTSNDHSQGNETAPIVLVEYGDYQCTNCGAAYIAVKKLQSHFGDRLLFVFRNFPLVEAHPYAKIAAEAAEFCDTYGRFWEMHDLIYENQENLGPPFLLLLAEKLKLPVHELEIALEKGTYDAKIKNDFLGGVRSGVNGTPTFFINGQRHDGSFELKTLADAINSLSS
jgi:protein-disulfide isomerase